MPINTVSGRWRYCAIAAMSAVWCFLIVIPQKILAEEGVLVDRIVAEVNEDIITLYELNRKAAPLIKRVKAMARPLEEERRMIYEVREKVLNQMIDEKLTDQEIERYNIRVSEETIDNAIEEMKKRSYMTDQKLRASLEQEGLTMEEYRDQIKNQILRARLLNREVKSKIVITDEDVRDYYNKHKSQYVGEGRVHLRQIVMTTPPSASEAEKQEIRDQLNAIRREVAEGASFAALAREYSQSPLAGEGGDLGAFAMGDLAPEILRALEGVAAGGVTSIVENDRGMQLFYVESLEQAQGRSLEEVSEEIEDILYDEIVNRKFADWLQDLRERSHIKVIR